MAKSPFATKEVHTYKYPEPFDQKKEDESVEEARVNGATDPDSVRRIDPEEIPEGHYVTIRIPRSRADVDAVADHTQSMVVMGDNGDGAKFEQRIAHANREVFDLLAESWSFDAECNGSNYARLDTWSGDWITACLGDAVGRGTTRDYAKKTPDSSKTQEPSAIAALPQAQEE